jgi:hypothetical protein
MSPAFSSVRNAALFALLLLLLLLSPVLVPSSALPSRDELYRALPRDVGPFGFIDQQIYHEKDDIDIALIGPSQIWCDINTPYLQEALSKKLGRPAVVISLCWPWSGFDAVYMVARDLLSRRKVRLLVFCDASGARPQQQLPHQLAWRWFRFAQDAGDFADFPLAAKVQYYYGSILGMPRNLIAMLRPGLPAIATPEKLADDEVFFRGPLPSTRLGSMARRDGFALDTPPVFREFVPSTTASPDDVVIYSPVTADEFDFQKDMPAHSLQSRLAKKFVDMARSHGTSLACIYMPWSSDMKSTRIKEQYDWPALLGDDVKLVGIPGARLFAGMSEKDVTKLYWDFFHFNENGQNYFTPIVTPRLLELYDDAKTH